MRIPRLALLDSAGKDIRDSILGIEVPAKFLINSSKNLNWALTPGRLEIFKILQL